MGTSSTGTLSWQVRASLGSSDSEGASSAGGVELAGTPEGFTMECLLKPAMKLAGASSVGSIGNVVDC